MKTKILTMLAVAAGSAAAICADIYSLNVVGYVNVTVPAGLTMIANQLNTTNNTLASLLPAGPSGVQIYKYTGAGYQIYEFDEFDQVWYPSGGTLNPGEGAFVRNNTGSPLALTFVGEVMQGLLTNNINSGLQIRSSMVPQSGTPSQIGLPSNENLQLYKYVSGVGYTISSFDPFDQVWSPEVNIGVGEAFFIRNNGSATQWVRNFSAN